MWRANLHDAFLTHGDRIAILVDDANNGVRQRVAGKAWLGLDQGTRRRLDAL